MKKINTVGLHMIVKDEVEAVTQLVKDASIYVDAIYLTVSDKDAYTSLQSLENNEVHVDYRPWNNRFDEARQHNWDLGKEDASFWIDADDWFDFSAVPKMVAKLNEGIDAIFLPYHYDHDDEGNVVVMHWRERMINREKPFKWKGWVHENLICEEKFIKENMDFPVVHHSDHREVSMERNHKILEEAYEKTKDPRYIHYLGVSYFTLGEYQKAIDILREYVAVGGWDEEIYRSLIKMAEASYLLNKYEEAVQYCTRGIALMPDYPQGYQLMAQLEFQENNYPQALEWVKTAMQKPQPETSSIVDPTAKDRTILTGAICEYKAGNHEEAMRLLDYVRAIDVSGLKEQFKEEVKIDNLASVLPAIAKYYDKPEILWEGLPTDIRYDNRFRKLRQEYTKPKKWKKKSIAYFCGKGYEEWGAHTADKGMGGSEEAVLYLTQEFAKQGYDVTVFGEVSEPYEKDGVKWKPWRYIDYRDQFDTLIIWRYPQFASQFKANKMLIDMHDLMPSDNVAPYNGVTYLFKSQYHKDQYPQIENYNVISNGIRLEQFND